MDTGLKDRTQTYAPIKNPKHFVMAPMLQNLNYYLENYLCLRKTFVPAKS